MIVVIDDKGNIIKAFNNGEVIGNKVKFSSGVFIFGNNLHAIKTKLKIRIKHKFDGLNIIEEYEPKKIAI